MTRGADWSSDRNSFSSFGCRDAMSAISPQDRRVDDFLIYTQKETIGTEGI